MPRKKPLQVIILVILILVPDSVESQTDSEPECPSDLFKCGTEITPQQWCISRAWVCDGERDCPDGSDEVDCGPITCPSGKRHCSDGRLCIPEGWWCDKEEDCMDGSDESPDICTYNHHICHPNQFQCNSTMTCIRASQRCNNIWDCPDASDEVDCTPGSSLCASSTCPTGADCRSYMVADGEQYLCACQEGSYYNGSACVDLNECHYNGYCDQLCSNVAHLYNCSCAAGYLETSDKLCNAINEPPDAPTYILYANRYEIRKIYLNGSDATPPLNLHQDRTLALDYDFDNQTTCFVTERSAADIHLQCAQLNDLTNSWEFKPTYGLKGVQSISRDWVAKNWYFTDETHERIFVCSDNFSVCVTLIITNLKSPKSIAVDPLVGYMFFTTISETAKVERALLDGSSRRALVKAKQVVRPHALTLDYVLQHVYWADLYLDKIERIGYDGEGRVEIMKKSWIENIFGLAVHERFLYTASHTDKSITRIHRYNHTYNWKVVEPNQTEPHSLKVVHRQRQPTAPVKPCLSQNCSHLCIHVLNTTTNHMTAKCLCKAGYKLQNDTQCVFALEDRFLLYANGKLGEIKGISLNLDNPIEVMPPVTGLTRPVAVDYDASDRFIYYSDTPNFSIGRVKLDGSRRTDTFISSGIGNCEGIAIDWMGKNIYWTDENYKTISVARLDNPSIRKILIQENMTHPRAIVLDPRVEKGYMYWSDWAQSPAAPMRALISRANMDGTDRQELVTDTIMWVNGLSLDYPNNKLYFCDAYTDRIEVIDLNNNNSRSIILSQGSHGLIRHPYGLVHLNRPNDDQVHFFWTEFVDGTIKHIVSNRGTMGMSSVIKNESQPLFEIRLYDHNYQISLGRNRCTNSPCSHLCLAKPNGFICACPDSMTPLNGTTCQAKANYSSPLGCTQNDEFECDNKKCINKRWLCDGDNDCGDNSDENNESGGICENKTCSNEKEMYKCANNKCIYRRWLCDGEDDCRNNEDEAPARCNQTLCSPNMSHCANSQRCIPNAWFCDLDDDCGDGSDEKNCNYSSCGITQFTCDNQRCISLDYVCDGDNDCRDHSDERDCPDSCKLLGNNNETSFRCASQDQCISRALLCDGEPNCADGSDESEDRNCDDYNQCSQSSQFQCDNSFCIYIQLRCDGDDDCGDGSDEEGCNANMTCSDPEDYKCPGEARCLPPHWLCDGDNDCQDSSDELEANCTIMCSPEIPADGCIDPDTRGKICLPPEKLCDDHLDCVNGTDEGGLCDMEMCTASVTMCEHQCYNAPDGYGYVCTCRQGETLAADGKSCIEADPCSKWGVCSQGCEPANDGSGLYYCTCLAGYTLAQDRFTCKPTGNETTYIIFSNRHEIRRMDVDEKSYVSLVSGLRNTIALDFYYNKSQPSGDGSLVFWTDVVDDKIYKGTLISNSVTNIQAIVNIGLSTTEGIAVDWIGQHIYWVESNLDQIEVATFDGLKRATLIAGNITSPRAIVVDPRRGMLFWSDWDTRWPRIEKASMSGENRSLVFNVSSVPSGGWPNGLTIDYDSYRLYWIDARSDSIHSIDYDGGGHQEILKGHEFLSHPFAISVFGNYVYWTDWRTNSLVQANKWNGTGASVIQRTITQPFDLLVFHPLRQPQVTNPCAVNNGGCSSTALCLLTINAKPQCKCPHLYKLTENRTACELDSQFLLYARKQEIRGVDILSATTNFIPALTVPYVYNPLAIDHDTRDKKIYWVDGDPTNSRSHHGIIRANLNGTGVEIIIDSDLPNPGGFAIDWLSRNMYFTSYSNTGASISVSRLDGVFRKVLLDNNTPGINMTKPDNIAVHPLRGFMYWSDSRRIFLARLDGSRPRQIFPVEAVHSDQYEAGNIHSLVVDYDKDELWFINSHESWSQVLSVGLDGKTTNVHVDNKTSTCNININTPSALAVYNNILYIANNDSSTILTATIVPGHTIENCKELRIGLDSITALKIFREIEGRNNCADGNNGGCSQLCLPTGDKNGQTCGCTVGYQPLADGTCQGVESFLMYSEQTNIVGVPLHPETPNLQVLAPMSKISKATALDFYAAEDYIYWVDSQLHTISRIKRDLTGRQTLITSKMFGIEGVAIDWIAGNMYWVDTGLEVIEVAKLDGTQRFVVVSDNLYNPNSLVLHPQKGYMYWASHGNKAGIECAYLDGKNRHVLVNDSMVKKPVHLAIDYDTNTLYWYDKEKLTFEGMNLDQKEKFTIGQEVADVSGLDVFQGYLYWVDSGSSSTGASIHSMKTDGSNKTTLRENIGSLVHDIKLFHQGRQTGNNLCAPLDSSCEELCLYRNDNQTTCQCAYGQVNGTKCVEFTQFLAFSKVTGIDTVHMFDSASSTHNRPKEPITIMEYMSNVIGLTFDYDNKKYFYSDIQRGDIQSVFFNGTYDRIIMSNVGSAEGLTYDGINQYLYWTSYTDSSINRLHLYANQSQPHKIIQLTSEDHPRAIVVDSCRSQIYWTNWNDRHASIQKAFINGHGVASIVDTDIRTPNGLAIDLQAQKLYWSDARLDKIERCDYNGQNRKVIIRNMPQHIFGLALFGDYLFWTDWMMRGVIRANKYTGSDIKWLRKNIERQPMGIVAVGKITCVNNCSHEKGGCSDICDLDVQGEVTCACYEGRFLKADNRTCMSPNGTCGESEFGCRNGFCILYDFICDGRSHCADGSDEDQLMCEQRVCPESYFPCQHSYRCVPAGKRCDHINDCPQGEDEDGCGCGQDEFQCGNGLCIQARYRCDFDKDCNDASDEIGCNVISNCRHFMRQENHFAGLMKCPNTTACILEDWKCDGHNDCWDNWDEEQNCQNTSSTCPSGWFSCDNGECIPEHWRCDGDDDCTDSSDEIRDCQHQCPADKFQCDGNRCIPRSWLCDQQYECRDHTDERNCNERVCHSWEFSCDSSNQCLPKSWVCDGEEDCAQGEDELLTAGCKPVPCDRDEFQCLNYQCVPGSFYCDGDIDCLDGSDEPRSCPLPSCGRDQFRCKQSKACIPLAKKCDGRFDCSDHSDEANGTCITQPACGNRSKFKCDNGICINETLVCDTRNDCGDNSDELLCNLNECLSGHVCQHNCTDQVIGYKCTCMAGYHLQEDGHMCTDIDECVEYPCSHFCMNTMGSYRCLCQDGYRLSGDKSSCRDVDSGVTPVLMFSNRYYIRNVTLGWANNVELVAMNLTNAVALDFDWEERRIYWSDVTSTSSRILRMYDNGTQQEILHSSTLRNPDGIAVDWVGRNLYWCDKTTDTIEVSKLNGLYRKILVRDNLQEPRAIAVHPYMGYLFYTDWGDNAHIGRLGMDGSKRETIISDNLGWPNALTLDMIAGHVIWADARLDYIAMSDLNGQGVQYIVKSDLPHIFAITQFEEYIYWTDWEYKSVERAHKYRGDMRKNLTHTIHRPMDIHVYHPYRQLPLKRNWLNPCAGDGGCKNGTLCLLKPGGTGRVCACPEHHHPSPDKLSCIANCTSSEFYCNSTYKCIPFWWKCNKHDDCGDNSDEPPTCDDYVCRQPGLYQCKNATSEYQCITPTQLCDGIEQCPNGSDEKDCHDYTCMDSQFKCQNDTKCIPLSQKCNGLADCSDSIDEKDCPPHRCATNQFQCDNKRCIPYVWRCDHDNDCGDNSDEPDNCPSSSCRTGFIKCNNTGRCVPESWKCDGDEDCGDGSDEPPHECNTRQCNGTYFHCNNSRCIPRRWRCDYDDDCRDGSDELNCPPRNCSESEFRCNNSRCIPGIFRCDGRPQCADGFDELNCDTSPTCNMSDVFHCVDSGFCIPSKWKCDGEFDCADRTDEKQCSEVVLAQSIGARCSVENEDIVGAALTVVCLRTEFGCDGTRCIPAEWICDGQKDCFDATDEKNCGNNSCAVGYFRCVEDQHCVPYSRVCDGIDDCAPRNGSDEKHCPGQCGQSETRCLTTGQCISPDLLCDGHYDCVDHSDEEHCAMRHKCSSDADCPHSLSACNVATSRCDCKPGYQLTQHGCEDINECEQYSMCHQVCLNNPGSYSCHCQLGFKSFRKEDSSLACIPPGPTAYLLIATENEILKSSTLTEEYNITYPKSKGTHQSMKISGMDIHMPRKMAFFTNALGETPSIHRYPITNKLHSLPSLISHTEMGRRRRRRQVAGVEEDRADDGDQPVSGGLVDLQIANLQKPVDLAIDWVSDKIYWLDAGTHSLQMADLEGQNQRTIISTNIDKPGALVLDPKQQRIYWTDFGKIPKIESANLDGSGRRALVREDIYQPSGIAIDHAAQRLYWTDSKRGTVETADLEGNHREVIKQFGENEDKPYKIEVYVADLYVTTFRNHSIHKIHNKSSSKLVSNLPRIGAIVIVQDMKQQDYANDSRINPCYLKPCVSGSICVNKYEGACDGSASCRSLYDHSVCLCPDNKVFDEHNNCTEDRTPKECEIDCKHGGTCATQEHGLPKCQCAAGYSGEFCELDLCDNYCLNNGTCHLDSSGHPICNCTYKYEGQKCDHYKCTQFCHTNGICYVELTTGLPKCVCDYNHTGERCDVDAPGCTAYPCYHERQCLLDYKQRPICDCGHYYSGAHCEDCLEHPADYHINKSLRECIYGNCTVDTNVTPHVSRCLCEPDYMGDRCDQVLRCRPEENKCEPQNTKACIPAADGSVKYCECKLGFSGVLCKLVQGCDIVNCLNGGICEADRGQFVCRCPQGFMGELCRKRMPEECRLHCGDHGVCQHCDTTASTPSCDTCRCHQYYSGAQCGLFSPEEHVEDPNSVVAIAVPVVVCLILVFLIAAVCIYRRRDNSQFKHMRMAESGNVEITNPIYMRDFDDDEPQDLPDVYDFEADKPTNFTNPMYDTLYNDNASGLLSPDQEKNTLLKEEKMQVRFYGEEERQPLGHSDS